jgi:catechol 2,3-dioxygenase-like lactoylglutathione lyase family enzyme
MSRAIPGLHHVTAISGPPQANVDFYVGTMRQRLVKTPTAPAEASKPGFPIWIRPTRPKAAETLARPRIPAFTRRVRQDSAT